LAGDAEPIAVIAMAAAIRVARNNIPNLPYLVTFVLVTLPDSSMGAYARAGLISADL
jgi:hypothetical protein